MAEKKEATLTPGDALVRAILAEMHESGVVPDAKEAALLDAARQLVNRIDALERIVTRDGEMVTLGNGSVRMHPAIAEHRQLCATLPKVLQGIIVGDSSAVKDPVKQRAAHVRWARRDALAEARAAADG